MTGKRSSLSDQSEHLVTPALHVLRRDQRLEVETQEGLGVRRAHVEVPVLVVHRDAVEVGDLAVRVVLLDLAHLGLLVAHLGVDLARDEVLRPVGLEHLRQRLALDRQQLEDQQGGDAPPSRRCRSRGSSSGPRPRRRTRRPRRASGS